MASFEPPFNLRVFRVPNFDGILRRYIHPGLGCYFVGSRLRLFVWCSNQFCLSRILRSTWNIILECWVLVELFWANQRESELKITIIKDYHTSHQLNLQESSRYIWPFLFVCFWGFGSVPKVRIDDPGSLNVWRKLGGKSSTRSQERSLTSVIARCGKAKLWQELIWVAGSRTATIEKMLGKETFWMMRNPY